MHHYSAMWVHIPFETANPSHVYEHAPVRPVHVYSVKVPYQASPMEFFLWPLFHKTSKTSLHRPAGLCKDICMCYETESWTYRVKHMVGFRNIKDFLHW